MARLVMFLGVIALSVSVAFASCAASSCLSSFEKDCACSGFWFLASCSCAPRTIQWTQAGCSPDSKSVALMQMSFTEKAGCIGCGSTSKSNFKHRIFVEDIGAPASRKQVGGLLNDQPSGDVIYMKSAAGSYVLTQSYSLVKYVQTRAWYLTRVGTFTGQAQTQIAIHQITLADYNSCILGVVPDPSKPAGFGNEPLPDDCGIKDIIPSPDGMLLAVIQHDIDRVTRDRTKFAVKVTFLSAAAPLNAPLAEASFDMATGNGSQIPGEGYNYVWTPEGFLVVQTNFKAVSVTTKGTAAVLPTRRSCMGPATSSSAVCSASPAKRVSPSATGTIVFEATESTFRFGCPAV